MGKATECFRTSMGPLERTAGRERARRACFVYWRQKGLTMHVRRMCRCHGHMSAFQPHSDFSYKAEQCQRHTTPAETPGPSFKEMGPATSQILSQLKETATAMQHQKSRKATISQPRKTKGMLKGRAKMNDAPRIASGDSNGRTANTTDPISPPFSPTPIIFKPH